MKSALIISAASLLLLSSCVGSNQERKNIFPLPCVGQSHYGRCHHYYYIDKTGVSLDMPFEEVEDKSTHLLDSEINAISPFCDGLALVNTDAGYRYVNTKGEVVISIDKSEDYGSVCKATVFSEGIAFVSTESDIYKAIDTDGNELFTIENMDPVYPYIDGYMLVEDNAESGYAIIDRKGNIVLDSSYGITSLVPPANGYVCVSDNSKFGAIDMDGKQVVDFIANSPITFDGNGCAVVYIDGAYGLVDDKGKFILQPEYEYLENDGEWYQFVYQDEDLAGWCDKNGNVKIEPIVTYSSNWGYEGSSSLFFGDKWALVEIDGESVYIDKNGTIQNIDTEYTPMTTFFDDVAIVQERTANGWTYHLINRAGEVVSENAFAPVASARGGNARAHMSRTLGQYASGKNNNSLNRMMLR